MFAIVYDILCPSQGGRRSWGCVWISSKVLDNRHLWLYQLRFYWVFAIFLIAKAYLIAIQSDLTTFVIDLTAFEINLTALKRLRGVQLETMKPDQFGCSGIFKMKSHHVIVVNTIHIIINNIFININKYMLCDKQMYQNCRIAQRR